MCVKSQNLLLNKANVHTHTHRERANSRMVRVQSEYLMNRLTEEIDKN